MTTGLGLALASALAYGVADFFGALAARSLRASSVALRAQAVGAAISPLFLLLAPGALSVEALAAGVVAGAFGGTGLALYFRSLAMQSMGAVAPVNGIATAAVPVALGIALGERPALLAWIGIGVSLVAIVLTSLEADPRRSATRKRPAAADSPIALALLSGTAFGLFFAILALAPDDAGAWPVVASKIGSLAALGAWAAANRDTAPPATPWKLVAASGVFDVAANLLFLLATTVALVSVTSVVVSALYPLVLVLLAAIILRERLHWWQYAGVAAACAGITLISLS